MRIAANVIDALLAHARRESPRECCGLLIGTDAEVLEAVPADNAADDPSRQFEISPADYVAQIRRCRGLAARDGTPLSVVGGYHSHPHSAPAPSPTDLEQAFGGFLYLIAGRVGDDATLEVRGYRWVDGKFETVALDVVAST